MNEKTLMFTRLLGMILVGASFVSVPFAGPLLGMLFSSVGLPTSFAGTLFLVFIVFEIISLIKEKDVKNYILSIVFICLYFWCATIGWNAA